MINNLHIIKHNINIASPNYHITVANYHIINNNMNILSNLIKEKIENKFKIVFKPTREFYKTVGIGQKRWQQLLMDKVSPTIDELKSIASYFEVPITELFDNNEK